MKLQVKSLANEAVKEIEVPDSVFGYPYKEHLIHEAVVAVRAAQRSGSHNTKRRDEVQGSGRKLWRQKGTGRARVGSIRTPLWRGGGTVHGPKPRSHEKGLSVREKKNALRSALSRKARDQQILVIDSLQLQDHKTKGLATSLQSLGLEGKVLIVDQWENDNLGLASRNLPKVKAVDALAVNVYDVVDRDHLVISEEALGRLVGMLGA